tara:strand:- start:242 stop:478 length:237 start_codon:yes stop_codon:yes gene_type:complete
MPDFNSDGSSEPAYQAEVVVKVLQTAISSMQKLGLTHSEALTGILSQVAVQVEPEAMKHAVKINKQLHEIYKNLDPNG